MRTFPAACFFLILLLCPLCVGPAAAASSAFFSDYVSFIGQDESGYILFALDTSRGIDGSETQAEHFGVLYDQYQGWVNLVGTGGFDNRENNLEQIPDSPTFQYSGTPASGLTVRSRANDLQLAINPVASRMREKRSGYAQQWGTAAALLSWQGRAIPGRVIYAGLATTNTNRMSRLNQDAWDNFEGFYLSVKTGAPANWQDIYLRGEGINRLRRTRGFIDAGRRRANMISPDLQAIDKGWAAGFYRWDKAWKMSLQQVHSDGRVFPPFAKLELHQVSRKNVSNWVLGGFAMSVIDGTIEINGQQIPVLGLVEQIR